MGFARVVVTLDSDTGIPADDVMNVWHFQTPTDPDVAFDTIHGALDTFYNSFGDFWSVELAGTASTTMYDLEQPTPREPVATDTFTITTETDGLPAECAVCLSFQGTAVSGTPQARRRGRLYFGPCAKTVAGVEVLAVRPTGTARTNITDAAGVLMGTLDLGDIAWSVFSPTIAGPEPWSTTELNNAFTPVDNGWVDNAFDTQRRRGTVPSTRTIF